MSERPQYYRVALALLLLAMAGCVTAGKPTSASDQGALTSPCCELVEAPQQRPEPAVVVPVTNWTLAEEKAMGNKTLALRFQVPAETNCVADVALSAWLGYAIHGVVALWRGEEPVWVAFSGTSPSKHVHAASTDSRETMNSVLPVEDFAFAKHHYEGGLAPGNYSFVFSAAGLREGEHPFFTDTPTFLMSLGCQGGFYVQDVVGGGGSKLFGAWTAAGGVGASSGDDAMIQLGDEVPFESPNGIMHFEVAGISGIGRFSLSNATSSHEWLVGDADLCLPMLQCPRAIRFLGGAGDYVVTSDWASLNTPILVPGIGSVPYADGTYVGILWNEHPIAEVSAFLSQP